MTTCAEFLGLPTNRGQSSKPRNAGLTMIMDQAWPTSFTAGMLEALGQYVDIVKLWDPHLLEPRQEVEKKIALYREHDVIVQPGGLILELARQHGNASEMLPRLVDMGFNAVEMSSTTSTRDSVDEEAQLMKEATGLGLMIYGEVGRKFADGDETRLSDDTLDVDRTVYEFKALLAGGARQVYWEGHLLRRVMGDDPEDIKRKASTGTQQVLEVVRQVGKENILFEVSGLRPIANRQWLQFWLVRLFGPDVNIANARIEEMGNLEAIRGGMHPIFGFGHAGNYPWMRAQKEGREEWWRA